MVLGDRRNMSRAEARISCNSPEFSELDDQMQNM